MEAKVDKLLIAINLLVIITGCIIYSRLNQDEIIAEKIPLYSWGGETGTYNYVDDSFQNAKFWFAVSTGPLEKGIYHVHISYETNSAANSIGFYPDLDGYNVVLADATTLDPAYGKLDQEIWINKAVGNMNISIDRENVGYLRINNITVSRAGTRSFTYLMMNLLLKFLALDGIYLIIRCREKIREHYAVVLGLSCTFMVSALGVFTNSIIEGHDIWFHLARIEGIKDGLMSGALPVKIQPNWLNGYGFAVSTMYGDILLYIPAVLRALGMPMQFAYKFYLLFISLLTVLISYFAFFRIGKDKYIGILASAIYSMSIYRIGSIWVRSGVGEFSAMAFFPLVVLGVWELLIDENADDNVKYGWIWLAAGYTGMIQTHVLSCEVVTVFVAVVCLIRIRQVFRKRTFIAFCKAVGTVIIVNLWFLVPFLDYFREDFKVFGEKNIEYIQRVGITLYQMLSITTGGRGTYQRNVPGVSGTVPFSLGMTPLIILISASILLSKKEWMKKRERNIMAACLGLAVLGCFMSTCLFPWDTIAMLAKPLANLIVSIRRPTRFMTVAVTLIPLLACLVFMHLKERLKPVYIKILVVGLCGICAVEGLLFSDFIMRGNSNIKRYDGEQMVWNLAISGAEYFYTGTDCLAALTDTEIDSDISIQIAEKNYNRFLIECKAGEDGGYIELPIFFYRGYQVMDTVTEESFEAGRGANNKLRITIPADYDGKLDVRFKEPWYWRASELISLVAVLAYCGAWVWRLKRGGRQCCLIL